MSDLLRSRLIAETAHMAINHKRKYTGDDYIIHPNEVYNILIETGVKDQTILSSAWLHDVVEDTGITIDFLKKEVGFHIANTVSMLTDISKPEDGNRATRKRIDREHYKTADFRGKTVKLADCLSNGRNIKEHDKNFSVTYFKEIELLLPYLKGGNKKLYLMTEEMIKQYFIDTENERLQNALNKK